VDVIVERVEREGVKELVKEGVLEGVWVEEGFAVPDRVGVLEELIVIEAVQEGVGGDEGLLVEVDVIVLDVVDVKVLVIGPDPDGEEVCDPETLLVIEEVEEPVGKGLGSTEEVMD